MRVREVLAAWSRRAEVSWEDVDKVANSHAFLKADRDRLAKEVEAVNASHDDESAAHQETLEMLARQRQTIQSLVPIVREYEERCRECGPTCIYCPLCRKARTTLGAATEGGE